MRSIHKINEIVARCKAEGSTEIGQDAFMLYDTYGFPLDLTRDVAEEEGLTVDEAGFDRMMEQQQEQARQAQRRGCFCLGETGGGIAGRYSPTEFCGYQRCSVTTNIQAVVQDGKMRNSLRDGAGLLVLAETPFYAESGGQVADQGVIIGAEGRFLVEDVQKAANWFVHYGRAEGILTRGEEVRAEVDEEKRLATACNHTATHLLH